MKIQLTRKRDTSERDPLVVMVAPPEDYPGPKIVHKFEIGKTVDLDALVKEKKLKGLTGEELGHVIMGDKRYKGLFKIVTGGTKATAKTIEVDEDEVDEDEDTVQASAKKKPTPTPKKKKKTVLNKSLRNYEDKNLEAEAG